MGHDALALNVLYQTVGHHLLQVLREAIDAQLATTFAQLTPQILATVRDAVRAQMPDLLAELLQREIAQRKHAAEQDQGDD